MLCECNVITATAVSSAEEAGGGTAHHPWGSRRGIPDLSLAPSKGKGIKILLGSTFIKKNLIVTLHLQEIYSEKLRISVILGEDLVILLLEVSVRCDCKERNSPVNLQLRNHCNLLEWISKARKLGQTQKMG